MEDRCPGSGIRFPTLPMKLIEGRRFHCPYCWRARTPIKRKNYFLFPIHKKANLP